MKSRLLSPAIAIAACLAASAVAQTTQPGGIDLPGVEYAYPTQRFAFTSQRQPLEMAYMDVAPTGEANGRTIVLLHGKNFNGDYWGRTARDLAAAGFRVVVPDQVGFGKSTKPEHYQFSFHQLAANTAALLDAIHVGRATIVGHSMGGMLATRFALMYPDRVERLALVNPIGLEDWKALGVPYRDLDAGYAVELKQNAESIRRYMQNVYYDGKWRPEYDRPVEVLASTTRGPDYPRLAWCNALTFAMCFTQPVVHEFPNLKVPTLLIIGTRDRTALGKDGAPKELQATLGRYDQLGRKAAAAIPGAKLVELDDVGHMPMLEAYERYIAPLREFVKGPNP